jgi:hypothetical protein
LSDLDSISLSVNYLAALEPAAGFSLAINLAYLNLKNFRYRQIIEITARKLLAELPKEKLNGDGFKALDQVKDLTYLENLDSDAQPSGARLALFGSLFGNQVDIYLCATLSVVSALILYGGVAENIGYMTTGGHKYSSIIISHWGFWILVGAALCPALFVGFGKYTVRYAGKRAASASLQLAGLFQAQIGEAQAQIVEAEKGVAPV